MRPALSFPRLQQLLETTSGNLATHLRKLEAIGYVTVERVLEGRSPVTYIGLSDAGRVAFAEYKRNLRKNSPLGNRGRPALQERRERGRHLHGSFQALGVGR